MLARRPDLVFLDFTINDTPYAPVYFDRLAAYESLVRRLVGAGVPVVQAIFAAKRDVLPGAPERPLDPLHREIAAAYGLPSGDAVTLMRERVAAGLVDADTLWPMAPDVTHPGDEGYALYAEAVWGAFERAVREGQVCRVPEKMLHPETYVAATRNRLSKLGALPVGWSVGRPHRIGMAFDFTMSRWLDDVTLARGLEAVPLLLVVRGRHVLLFGEATPLSGRYEVRVNGGEPTCYDAGANAKNGNFRLVHFIAQDLEPDRDHLIEIIPRLEAGQELRFESACIAGFPATVRLAAR